MSIVYFNKKSGYAAAGSASEGRLERAFPMSSGEGQTGERQTKDLPHNAGRRCLKEGRSIDRREGRRCLEEWLILRTALGAEKNDEMSQCDVVTTKRYDKRTIIASIRRAECVGLSREKEEMRGCGKADGRRKRRRKGRRQVSKKPRETSRASLTRAMSRAGSSPIFSLRRCLSMVRICSSNTTEF